MGPFMSTENKCTTTRFSHFLSPMVLTFDLNIAENFVKGTKPVQSFGLSSKLLNDNQGHTNDRHLSHMT